jgi:hypothetical protein
VLHFVRPKILVFLPLAAGNLIAAKLTEIGFDTSVVCSLSDLHSVIYASNYSLAVTTRPDIDAVRAIRPIPVVNLEIFFHRAPAGPTKTSASKFDGPAFVRRVKLLAGCTETKGNYSTLTS